MSTPRNGNHDATPLELDCSGYELRSGSMSFGGPAGPMFRSIIGPLTEDFATTLERAARTGAPVDLVFSSARLEFQRIEISRAEPGWFHLVGAVRSPPT